MSILARRQFLIGLGLLAAGCSRAQEPATGLARIRKTGVLRIGLEGTYPPFNYQDPSGQLTGFEVEFARGLAKQLNVRPDFQPAPFAGLLGALEAGRIDAVINQITITPERQAKYGFSEPYTVSGIQIIVRQGTAGVDKPADLAGKKVGVGLGTNYEQWLRTNAPQAIVRTYDDDPTKYQDLKAGRIDAALNDRLVAVDFLKRSKEPLVAAGPPFAPQGAGVAFLKDPELKTAIDQAIQAMRASGELTAISQKWFAADVTR